MGESESMPPAGENEAPSPNHRLSRRQFLLGAAGAGVAGATGVALSRIHRGPAESSPATVPSVRSATPAPGIAVLLTLYGGNDGLNTLIPYQDGHYLGGRSQLGYAPDQVIPLDDTLALHPSMKGFKQLWDAGQLAIVRGVGYPDPNRSHFRSMDIWQSGVPDGYETTGWLGRWLDGTGTDPLRAVSVGSSLPRAFAGANSTAAVVPEGSLALPVGPLVVAGFADLVAPDHADSLLMARAAASGSDLLRVDETITDLLAAQPPQANVQAASPGGVAPTPTYGSSDLATQLQLVAKLIHADMPASVYGVSLGGFDTHANEKDTHARLWGQVDAAVSGFLGDVARAPRGSHVVLLAYSEFGRRVAANASGGTDHGTAAPVFVAGAPVKGGFYGDEPSLTDLDAGDLKFTTDFRSVYATIVANVLGVDPRQPLGKAFAPIPFL